MLGTTIAHYKITAKLGQGGMGEVYRAIDTKLDREVAIKVLPDIFAQDKERLARFEREAKTLATLNHPNIAGIFGLEETEHSQALVLELVEGEDLSEALKRGPLPVEEALDICKQIAEALEAAHEKGIIHRDLKPGNIKITSDGLVKVLDFGLAKALAEESDVPETSSADDSPTITDAFTKPGTILGTASYMSPEQTRGRLVDTRTDIWAFGCVIFECLTGVKAFQGDDTTDTLAGILKGEPNWALLPETTPSSLYLLIRKCLNKNRHRRQQHISDARIDIEQLQERSGDPRIFLSENAEKVSGVNHRKVGLMVTLAATVTGIIAGYLSWKFKPIAPIPQRKLNVNLEQSEYLASGFGKAAVLSPDGAHIAYIADEIDGDTSDYLFIRSINALKERRIDSTEGIIEFCWSPDSQEILFRSNQGGRRQLKVVSIEGSAAVPVTDVTQTRGMDWASADWIAVALDKKGGLSKVSRLDGSVEPLTTLSDGELTHRWPQIVKDGTGVLYTSHTSESDWDAATIQYKSLDSEASKTIIRGGFSAQYIESGHLIFMHHNTLFGAKFDLNTLTMGNRKALVEGVFSNFKGAANYSVSDKGTLFYLAGDSSPETEKIPQWVHKDGKLEPLTNSPNGVINQAKLSPNGRYIAFVVEDDHTRDIWLYDIERSNPILFVAEEASDDDPVWSPTGNSMVFSSNREGKHELYWKRIGDSGNGNLLFSAAEPVRPEAWHPKGEDLLVSVKRGVIQRIRLSGSDALGFQVTSTEIENIGISKSDVRSIKISPDGTMIAFQNKDKSGYHIFTSGYPDGKQSLKVSVNMGFLPEWHPSKEQLFYWDRSSGMWSLMSVTFEKKANEWQWGQPEKWNFPPLNGLPVSSNRGQDKVLILSHPNGRVNSDQKNFIIFEGFFEYLQEKLP
jgi:serine/threonine-protein kinase